MKYNGRNRVQYARAVLLMQDKLELAYRRKVLDEIRRAVREYSAAAFKGSDAFASITREHESRMAQVLRELAGHTARVFAKVPFTGTKAKPRFETELDAATYERITTHAASKARGISQVTEQQVRDSISAGVLQGLTNAEIARQIVNHTGGLIAANRSTTIARTEVHTAANVAEYAILEQNNVVAVREWIATNDDRVRDTHAAADGQTVKGDAPFVVGGEELLHPGDPAGSAENVINCRCVVGYSFDDQAAED